MLLLIHKKISNIACLKLLQKTQSGGVGGEGRVIGAVATTDILTQMRLLLVSTTRRGSREGCQDESQ